MTKNVSIFLLCALLVACLSGCAIFNHFWSGPEEPTAPEQTVSKYNNPMGLPEDLLDTLVDFLKQYNREYELIGYSLEQQIDFIKQGGQTLHVGFDPYNLYFVCGYYNNTHEGSEIGSYCCTKEYTWVTYEIADEIQEYYNDAKMVVAFQINKALFVKDFLTGNSQASFKAHFQMYTPEFLDGSNTNRPLSFSEEFIYLNRYGESNPYYSTSHYNHDQLTLACLNGEGNDYIMILWYHLNPDGYCTYIMNFEEEFGKYYNSLMNIMRQEAYNVPHSSGAENAYALFKYTDLVDMILVYEE